MKDTNFNEIGKQYSNSIADATGSSSAIQENEFQENNEEINDLLNSKLNNVDNKKLFTIQTIPLTMFIPKKQFKIFSDYCFSENFDNPVKKFFILV